MVFAYKNKYFWQKSSFINLSQTILYISVFTEVLPVIFYLLFRKKDASKSLRVILILIILTIVNDLQGLYSIWHRKSNFLFSNFFVLIETVILYYYYTLVSSTPLIKRVCLVLSILFTIVCTFRIIEIGNHKYLTSASIIENISILILSIAYYYTELFKKNRMLIYEEASFWIITAYFVYSAGTFFLFVFMGSLEPVEKEKYYTLNYVVTILRTVLLLIAMLMKPSNKVGRQSIYL